MALWNSIRGSLTHPILRGVVGLAVFSTGVAAIVVLSRLFPELANAVWSAWLLDAVVLITLMAAAYIGGRAWSLKAGEREEFLKSAQFGAIGALVLVNTLYVTYASFRNQTRIAAETALNDEGMRLYEIEMNSPELRCLYYNYRSHEPSECLLVLVRDEKLWSKAIFYVEEGWFVLTQAGEDRREWGSTYAESIEYWATDVSRDPTGLFSYYLISGEESVSDAHEVMGEAGVQIPNVCTKYAQVWRALKAHNALPPRQHLSGAALECIAKHSGYFR